MSGLSGEKMQRYFDLNKMPPNAKIFDEAWILVYENLFDRNIRKGRWQNIGNRYKNIVKQAVNQKQVYNIIQNMLDELDVSHLRIMDPEVFDHDIESEVSDINFPSFGLDIEKINNKFYIRTIVEGSAAAEMPLKRGDRVIGINGVIVNDSSLIRPSGTGGVYRIHPRGPILLAIVRGSILHQFTMSPKPWNRISASAASGKIYTTTKGLICYIHLWHLANYKMVKMLEVFLNNCENCSGLLLDLRGFGGTIAYLGEFLDILKKWNRPIVAIIDKETRSIKETISYHLRRQNIATLVGEKTIGSVLASQFFDLSDGSKMIIPIMDMRELSGGKSLEKRGIHPDISVNNHTPLANGRDPVHEKGLEVIFRKI